MEKVKTVTEDEVILSFLKSEYDSRRFNKKLCKSLEETNNSSSLIVNGNINNENENDLRRKLIKHYRGYPGEDIFTNFPNNINWSYVKLSKEDINNLYYINYDYWNEISNNTSKPLEAVNNIKSGKEMNHPLKISTFIEGFSLITEKKFPPMILITCNNDKYLIIEGHSRATIYAFDPNYLEGTYAYVGNCSIDEMNKYDSRMV
jgi:hypothetical protein